MEIRVCPKCNKAFYTILDVDEVTCQYCGFILLDRRSEARHHVNLDFYSDLCGHEIPLKLQEYSKTGARIVYKGKLLSKDTVLSIIIKDLGIETTARTMWSKKTARDVYSYGLLFSKLQ